MPKRFFIIDGFAQIFRSYYAPFQNLTTPSGEPAKATHVFASMLLKLVREQKPDYLVMAFEGGDEVPTFRAEIDPEYKANREPPPEDLLPQIVRIVQMVESQSIPILSVPGYEADDVIATLCRRFADDDVEIYIVSKDKDLEQLLTDKVRLYDPGKDEFIGPAELREKKGYGPEQAIEIQTLTGDSTDNVPGIRGVGPKKALDLIRKYGSADEVIAHADELTPAMKQNVQAFADSIATTRQLVTLRTDAPVVAELESCAFTGLNTEALEALFRELGFRRLIEQIGRPDEGNRPNPTANAAPSPVSAPSERDARREYMLVDTREKLDAFLAELSQQKRFAFDTETTSLNSADAALCGLSFSWQAGRARYVAVRGIGNCLDVNETLDALRPIMTDPAIRKVGQNIKYDLCVLAHHGLDVRGVDFDTMIASFVLDSSRRSHGLDWLALEFLGLEKIPTSDLIGKGKNEVTFAEVDVSRAAEYACEDADATWQLYEIMSEQMAGSDLGPLFNDTEMPMVEVLTRMETEGVGLDSAFLAEMSAKLSRRLGELTLEIHAAAGHAFNIDSTKQLAVVLFDELELPVVKKTKTGRSTDAETLDTLAWQTEHPVPRLVKEYRELVKLKGTYIDPLPAMVSPRTGRIHASFHQTAAVTGRLSSSDPNLQNIPIRTEIGQQIRRAFVARDDSHLLLTADYSQVELRVLAHFCGDRTLRTAFAEDQDIHAFVAAQVFGVPIDQVSREQRGRAKAVNFGIIYGQTAYGLARGTGMSQTEAQGFIDMYFMRYPGIRMFIDSTIVAAKRLGYVKTILGRRRAVPEINSRNRNTRMLGERLAVNTVIQGSAADLIKRAMIAIQRRIESEHRPSRMLIQVHDELVFEIPSDAIEAEAAFIREEMCHAMPLDVPIKVDVAWGANWLESK